MICTHPVLYHRNGVLFCVSCGAEMDIGGGMKKNPPAPETAPEAPKKAVKRTRKNNLQK